MSIFTRTKGVVYYTQKGVASIWKPTLKVFVSQGNVTDSLKSSVLHL